MLGHNIVAAIGSELIAERVRQADEEGFTPERDIGCQYGKTLNLAKAAAAYAISAAALPGKKFTDWLWPWTAEWFKPRTPREDLVRAGALIIAQIQVIDAMAEKA